MKLEHTAEEYLAGIPMWAGKKNALKDIRTFLKEMGNPDDEMELIHVAGTNGKGSVCAYLTSLLLKAGYHTGTFISPHLVDTRERFLTDGEPVDKKLFEESYRVIRCLSEEMTERGFCHPSYFEFLFYMGMELFGREKPDFVILETGLGGRLDTTNVIRRPSVTVITSISLDHTEYLGDTIEKIAAEKAGIIKPGVPVVYERNDKRAAAVIEEKAKLSGCPVYPLDRQDYAVDGYRTDGIHARLMRLDGSWLKVLIPSQAEYQVRNALTAFRALEVLMHTAGRQMPPIKCVKNGLETMRWPGRMEEAEPGLYLDGAHNPGGVGEFTAAAGRLCLESGKRAFLLFSAVSDKAYQDMICSIGKELPLDGVAVAHIKSERGLSKIMLEQEFEAVSDCRVCSFDTVEEALAALISWQDEDHLLFCVGSLYLMGEIKEILAGRHAKEE